MAQVIRKLNVDDRSTGFEVSIRGKKTHRSGGVSGIEPLVSTASISVDNFIVSSHEDCSLHKWCPTSGEIVQKTRVSSMVSSLTVTSTGQLVAGFFDGTIRSLVDGADAEVLARFPGMHVYELFTHEDDLFALIAPERAQMPVQCAHESERIGMSERLARFCELDDRNLPYRRSNALSHQFYLEGGRCVKVNFMDVSSVDFLTSSHYVGNSDRTVLTMTLLPPAEAQPEAPAIIALGGADGLLMFHCSHTDTLIASAAIHEGPILCVASVRAPCERQNVFTGCADCSIGWSSVDFSEADCLQRDRLQGHSAEVTSLAYVPAAHKLFSGGADMEVLMWDLEAVQCTHRFLAPHRCTIHLLHFINSWLVTGATDGTIACWAIPCVCPLCGEDGLPPGGLEEHWEICPSKPRPCPLGCGEWILDGDKATHCTEQCEERNAPWLCKWGCGQRGDRVYQQVHHEGDALTAYYQRTHAAFGALPETHKKLLPVCPNKPVMCRHCRQPLRVAEQSTHELQCPDRKVLCTHLTTKRQAAGFEHPIACPEGCFEQVMFKNLAAHEVQCPLRPIACSLGCGIEIEQALAPKHVENECLHRVAQCIHQGCDAFLVSKLMSKHMSEDCQWRPVACSCGEVIPKQALANHQETSCILRVVCGDTEQVQQTVGTAQRALEEALASGDPIAIAKARVVLAVAEGQALEDSEALGLCGKCSNPVVEVRCPLGCEVRGLQRANIADHVQLDCNRREVRCDKCGGTFAANQRFAHLSDPECLYKRANI